MSDNQAAGLLGCYGNREVHTPNLDALATRGVRFENTYCVNAMCSPCRASVLTGLMPSQHGVHNWLDDQRAAEWPKHWNAVGEFETFPGILKAAGYHTALIGKYHLGDPSHPPHAFDHWVTFPHGHTTSFHGNDMIDNGRRYRHDGHSVEFFTDKTIEFIDTGWNRDQPFFAFVPYNGPYGHWPAISGPSGTSFDTLYAERDMGSVPREGLNSAVVDRYQHRVIDSGGQPREQFKGPLLLPNHVESLRNYHAQVSLIDAGVGRILKALGAVGAREDTLVIYTADHGFSLGHHGIWGHGLATWPSSLRRPSTQIPLLMEYPRRFEPGIFTGLVSQLDIGPTLLELAGLPPEVNAGADARSVLAALETGVQHHRDAIFMEQEETRAMRTQQWLYFQRFKHAPEFDLADELFDLIKDPGENHDCSEREAAVCKQLADELGIYFARYSTAEHDLWRGGRPKSNGSFDRFWKAAWGDRWAPV